MLYIERPSDKIVQDYWESIKDALLENVQRPEINVDLKKFLTNDKLQKIVQSDPEEMMNHHDQVMTCLYSSYSSKEYKEYQKLKKNQTENRDVDQNKLVDFYQLLVKELSSIFDYEKILTKPKAYNFAQNLNRNTCTYCNRSYTVTVIEEDSVTKRINDRGRIVRPNFDHWFAKSIYPVLALSFFNIIPSCTICNSNLKLNAEFSLKTHIHPYLDNITSRFAFSYGYSTSDKLKVILKPTGDDKLNKTLEDFRIEEIYNAHAGFELQDLYDLKHKYSRNYLTALFEETFGDLKNDEADIYRLIFGIEYDSASFHKRPFSKFKNDILKELRALDVNFNSPI